MTASLSIRLDLDKAAKAKLDRAMKTLPTKIYNKVIGQAANAAMTPILKAARRNCPSRYGLLRKSLGKKKINYKTDGVVVVLVGPQTGFKDPVTGANPVKYAHLVEDGTGPHKIAAKKGVTIGPLVIRGTVEHPGARPQPFMRPAYDTGKRQVLPIYRKRVLAGIEREAAKLT